MVETETLWGKKCENLGAKRDVDDEDWCECPSSDAPKITKECGRSGGIRPPGAPEEHDISPNLLPSLEPSLQNTEAGEAPWPMELLWLLFRNDGSSEPREPSELSRRGSDDDGDPHHCHVVKVLRLPWLTRTIIRRESSVGACPVTCLQR